MLTVTWFRNGHEYRNDYLRMALMRRHDAGDLRYRELPQEAGRDFGMSETLVTHEHRHTSVFVAEEEGRRRLCAIDNEDGFVHMQPFIEEVDLYFCCPYTSAFHRAREFPDPLPWQTEFDVAPYRTRAAALVERYGDHFDKVRPLIPTPTSMSGGTSAMAKDERSRQIWAHRRRKLQVWKEDRELWRVDQDTYEARYRQMLGYRDATLRYDVVSRESLWGWPENRIALHERLHELKRVGYDVHAQLTPLSETHHLSRNELHISEASLARLNELTQPIDLDEPYELALASSRLAVFPTGYHWGWRGIAFLALCMGIPIYMDRPLYEPYFDFNEFEVTYNVGKWDGLKVLIDSTNEGRWQVVRSYNQQAFDGRLAPESTGAYIEKCVRIKLGSLGASVAA